MRQHSEHRQTVAVTAVAAVAADDDDDDAVAVAGDIGKLVQAAAVVVAMARAAERASSWMRRT